MIGLILDITESLLQKLYKSLENDVHHLDVQCRIEKQIYRSDKVFLWLLKATFKYPLHEFQMNFERSRLEHPNDRQNEPLTVEQGGHEYCVPGIKPFNIAIFLIIFAIRQYDHSIDKIGVKGDI